MAKITVSKEAEKDVIELFNDTLKIKIQNDRILLALEQKEDFEKQSEVTNKAGFRIWLKEFWDKHLNGITAKPIKKA